MSARILILFAALIILGGGCQEEPGLAMGELGGPCWPDLTCSRDLVCQSPVCIPPRPCEMGSTLPCDCPEGDYGQRHCQEDTTYGECVCPIQGCGNGLGEDQEECDGGDLRGERCTTLGFGGGVLRCDEQCAFDTSECDTCGNGVWEAPEDCDGSELDGATCTSLGYLAGTLTCDASCFYDTSGCHNCGNAAVDPEEDCEGTDLAGADCQSQGYNAGILACDGSCGFDTSGCANCTEASAGMLHVPIDMMVLLDRSDDMTVVLGGGGTLYDGTVAALTQFFNDPESAGVAVGMNLYPPAGCTDQCVPLCYYSTHVPLASLPGNELFLTTAMGNQPPGGQTPMAAILEGTLLWGTQYQDVHTDEKVVVVLVTAGDPTACNTTISDIGDLTASAFNYNGVPTHAIALQGADLANTAQIVSGSGQLFDATTDVTLLVSYLEQVRASAKSCTFALPSSVTDTQMLNLDYSPSAGATVRLGKADDLADCGAGPGWYYEDPAVPNTIVLCPESCNTTRADPLATLEAVIHCPSVPN